MARWACGCRGVVVGDVLDAGDVWTGLGERKDTVWLSGHGGGGRGPRRVKKPGLVAAGEGHDAHQLLLVLC